MMLNTLIVRCYPRAVRDRWGDGLQDELRLGGVRSSLDAVLGAVGLWLHPTIWPATSTLRRHGVLAIVTAVALAMSALIARATATELTTSLHPSSAIGVIGMTIAMIALLPTPRLGWRPAARLVGLISKKLTVPILGFGVLLTIAALSPVPAIPHQTAIFHALLQMGYWTILIGTSAQLIGIYIRSMAEGLMRAPGRRRTLIGCAIAVLSIAIGAAATSIEAAAKPALIFSALALTSFTVFAAANAFTVIRLGPELGVAGPAGNNHP